MGKRSSATVDKRQTVRKTLDCEVKQISEREFEFVASTETMDRDGEVIRASGWQLDNYLKNPVVTWAHDYRSPPIGRSSSVAVDTEKGQLINTVEFPPDGAYPFADTIRRLVEAGFVKAESVGFVPLEEEGNTEGDLEDTLGLRRGRRADNTPRRIFTKMELLEIAICPIPANPDALAVAKSVGVITEAEFDQLVTKPEEEGGYIRVPVPGEEGKHDGHRIRTIDIDKDKGIKALYCGEDKVVITYLFDKDKGWTMESAQAWVKEHSKKEISQAELKDELDYALAAIRAVGIAAENQSIARALAGEIMRSTGSDMPVEIRIRKDRDRMMEIKGMADKISRLCDAEMEDMPEEEDEKEASITIDDIKTLVQTQMAQAIRKAQGKIG